MELAQDVKIISSCYVLYVFLYGVLIIAIEVTSSIAFGLICPIIFFVLIKTVAIPRPSDSVVKAILGVDVWEQYKESLVNKTADKNIIENDDLVFRTIAHRAAGLDAPENSISALKGCQNKGCNFVEIDLSLTKDGIPIVFHDYTLDRMTGIPGNVQNLLWEELKNYDLIFQPDLKEKNVFTGEKIALFDEFIDLCVKLGIRVFIDIKDRREEVVKVVLETYKKHPSLYKTSLVSSFNPFIIYKIRKSNPSIACSMAWRPQYFSRKSYNPVCDTPKRHSSLLMHLGAVALDKISTWLIFHIIYYLLGLSAILIHKDAVSVGMISTWQNRKVRVIAWTVNSKIEKDFFANILNIPYMTDSLDYNHIHFKDNTIVNK